MDETGRAEKISLWKGLPWHVAIAFSLFFVDAVVFHQRILAIVTVSMVVVAVTGLLLGAWNRDESLIVCRNSAVYLVSALAIMAAFSANEDVANRNAETLIAAVTEFVAHRGRYPEGLQELTPNYIEAVPRVNYALTTGPFKYQRQGCGATPSLSYQCWWPIGLKRRHCFEARSWDYYAPYD